MRSRRVLWESTNCSSSTTKLCSLWPSSAIWFKSIDRILSFISNNFSYFSSSPSTWIYASKFVSSNSFLSILINLDNLVQPTVWSFKKLSFYFTTLETLVDARQSGMIYVYSLIFCINSESELATLRISLSKYVQTFSLNCIVYSVMSSLAFSSSIWSYKSLIWSPSFCLKSVSICS